uniref:Engulfment and cell motility protein 1 n=1 Tax=Cacopsylla melanoneura TaxID=428564 RepID=A0A8D8Q509_9HEMI
MTSTTFRPVKVQDANIVKIAVEMEGQPAQLYQLNQTFNLGTIIQDICNGWSLSESDQYALQFSDENNKNYITEKNRGGIKNGSMLRLAYSPSKTADMVLSLLSNESSPLDRKTEAAKKISSLSGDNTFAMEFIRKEGLSLITKLIQEKKCKGEILAHCLLSFVEIMDHGIVSWNILEPAFISTVAENVNVNPSQEKSNLLIIQASLSILESYLNNVGKYSQVANHLPLTNLVDHLSSPSPVIQQNAIALINALFIKAEPNKTEPRKTEQDKRRAISTTMCSLRVRQAILTNVLGGQEKVGAEMAHQLYVLQTLTLGLLEERMNTKMDAQDKDGHEKIMELRRVAFESDVMGGGDTSSKRPLGGYAKDYHKLGFKYDINPAQDFTETPPGMLALDCMIYFARNYPEAYTKVVLENSCRADEHECPFGRTSVELVKLLCEILRIGVPPNEQGVNYHPMFFTHDHPFEEFYCICIVLLNKTWKEMRATTEDFVKVFSVVKEQITESLSTHPANLGLFRNQLDRLTYAEITHRWQQKRCYLEVREFSAKPIVELRELIKPEIIDLIKQQRLGYLVEGTRFNKYTKGSRVKDQFWYVRLSPNHKVFQHGPWHEKSIPQLESLPNKLPVAEIKALLVGKDCPHMKDAKSKIKTVQNLAFSLSLTENGEMTSLDFVATDDYVLAYWLDGINALLGNKMTSKEATADLETLLSMEIKIRLLDAEGVEIPAEPPLVPEEPLNYDFNC